MAVGDEQFVATAAGIGPGLRAMKHDGPFIFCRRLDPERHGERMTAVEITDWCLHGVVAGKPDRLAMPACDERILGG